MASSKVMPSTSNSTNSDLNSLSYHHHHHNHHQYHCSNNNNNNINHNLNSNNHNLASQMISESMNVDGILREVYDENPATENGGVLLDAEINLIDAAGAISAIEETEIRRESCGRKTVEEVWREIVSGNNERKECKVEAVDEMMTLEDFLAKAGAGGEEADEVDVDVEEDVKVEEMQMSGGGGGGGLFGFDHPMVQCSYPTQPQPMAAAMGGVMVYGNGGGMEVLGGVRGKRRGGPILEPLDKAAQQRQRRMIKNRESAARSRERKQAYQVELESLAMKLEEENEQLLKEKAERTKERFKQLMEKVVPVVEKRRPRHVLRRVRSMQW